MNPLNAYDRHVLNFVLTWAPFGGHSDDDAFPEFGLDAQQLWDRFEQIADTPQSSLRLLDDWDATLIRRAQRQLQCLGAAPSSCKVPLRRLRACKTDDVTDVRVG